MKCDLKKLSLFATRAAIAGNRKSQSLLLAALALCVAVYAATPAHASSSKASANTSSTHQGVHYGTSAPEGQSPLAAAQGVKPDLTLIYTHVRPGVTYYLTDLALYNDRCQELTPGSWSGTEPSYGLAGQGYKYGYLANGECPGVRFKFRALYYTWTHDKHAKTDEFKAHWSGDGYKSSTITFKFDLDY